MTRFIKRRASRFFAVQALYQLEHSDLPLPQTIQEFIQRRIHKQEHDIATNMDEVFFKSLVDGSQEHKDILDEKIQSILIDGWRLDRIDAVMRAILRASAFEIFYTPETPIPIIINEYIEVAKSFFAQGEVNFVHVALDRLGKLRPLPPL